MLLIAVFSLIITVNLYKVNVKHWLKYHNGFIHELIIHLIKFLFYLASYCSNITKLALSNKTSFFQNNSKMGNMNNLTTSIHTFLLVSCCSCSSCLLVNELSLISLHLKHVNQKNFFVILQRYVLYCTTLNFSSNE